MEKSLTQSTNDIAPDTNIQSTSNLQDETSIAVANLTDLLDEPRSELDNEIKSGAQVHYAFNDIK